MSNENATHDSGVRVTRYEIGEKEKQMLSNWFYHAPKNDQADRYKAINESTRQAAETILLFCPPSRERDNAIDQLKMARMWANGAIAVNE